MNPEQTETFLTVAEVADWLKLNQQTVRNWIDQGTLPAVRVGRRVRIKRSDLDRVIAAGYRGVGDGTRRNSGGPSAADFWSGEPVGEAEPALEAERQLLPGTPTSGREDAAAQAVISDTSAQEHPPSEAGERAPPVAAGQTASDPPLMEAVDDGEPA